MRNVPGATIRRTFGRRVHVELALDRGLWPVRVDPNDSEHLYVGDGVRGSTMGFWISTDGGASFTKPAGWSALPAAVGIQSERSNARSILS